MKVDDPNVSQTLSTNNGEQKLGVQQLAYLYFLVKYLFIAFIFCEGIRNLNFFLIFLADILREKGKSFEKIIQIV